jgi:hypothetical protein
MGHLEGSQPKGRGMTRHEQLQHDVDVPWDGGKSGARKGVHGGNVFENVFVEDYGRFGKRKKRKRQQAGSVAAGRSNVARFKVPMPMASYSGRTRSMTRSSRSVGILRMLYAGTKEQS